MVTARMTSDAATPHNTDINPEDREIDDFSDLTPRHRKILLGSILIVALCGIVYELIIGAVSSYLLGNSVYQFSITVGFFMFAMGVGSYISQFIRQNLLHYFVMVEIALAVIGGICSITLFLTFPFSPFMYRTVMFAFILSIGTLVGFEIPILTRILAQEDGTRKSIANVLSLDYIGALIGSVAFPLFLLPSLGLVRSSFAIGLINICVALCTVLFLRDKIKHAKRFAIAILGILGALFALVLFASRISAMAQHHLYFDQVIWNKTSPYQNLYVTQDWAKRDLRLFIDGHLQFSESDEHRYHEALVHSVMSYDGPHENVLVLGGGDGLAVRELLKYDDISRIDLVDLDPEMTKLGTKFAPLVRLNKGAMKDPRVNVYNDDAFSFINSSGPIYDRVIIDMPDPHNEALSKLYAVEFYAMISRRMSETGVLISQSSSPYFANKAFWCVGTTLEDIFPNVRGFQITVPSFGLWGFQMASKSDQDLSIMPSTQVPTRYWTSDVFKAALTFGKDIARPESSPVNSIFEPIIYHLYLEDVTGNPLKKMITNMSG